MTLDEIRARTAARKAAGLIPARYPLAAPRASGPCRHRGADLTGAERAARGLSHARRWALCLHAGQPLGPVVCPCDGCGPKCRGYAPPH